MSAQAYQVYLSKRRALVEEKAKRISKALAWRERISIYRLMKWIKSQ